MAVKTGHKDQSLRERGDIADLFASALVLIRGDKRNETQRSHLRRALQLFQENRLGGVISSNEMLSPERIQQLLSLELVNLLSARDAAHFTRQDLLYVGELYLLHYSKWRETRVRKGRSVQACQQMLRELGLPLTMNLDDSGWIPPYANDPKVLELWARPRHTVLDRRRCDDGCASVGEWLRRLRSNARRWGMDLPHQVRAYMYVPPTWTPPPRNPEACRNYTRSE